MAVLAGTLLGAGLTNEAAAGTLDLAGFVQAHVAARSTDVACPATTECEVPFNNQRLRLKGEGGSESGSLTLLGKIDLIHDSALDNRKGEIRELYAGYDADNFSLRGGRQIVTWGVGDLLFINDIFPKDWAAFYSGQPLEYLKLGSDAAKLDLFMASTTLELVISDFRADRLPGSRQFVMASLFFPSLPRNIEQPAEPEIAMKLSANLAGWDTALYASRGYYHVPALMETAAGVSGGYPRLNTLGASLSAGIASGVLNLEAGYYDSEDDRDGSDPAIDNSQLRLLAGYTRQWGQNTTIGVQAYAEWMQDVKAYRRALPASSARRDVVRTVASLRFTQRYLHQTLTVNVFAFRGVSEHDAYLIPSVRYALSDNLWAELGANIFTGATAGMFGGQGDNDNVYFTVRYAF